jgi:hypothetical protein
LVKKKNGCFECMVIDKHFFGGFIMKKFILGSLLAGLFFSFGGNLNAMDNVKHQRELEEAEEVINALQSVPTTTVAEEGSSLSWKIFKYCGGTLLVVATATGIYYGLIQGGVCEDHIGLADGINWIGHKSWDGVTSGFDWACCETRSAINWLSETSSSIRTWLVDNVRTRRNGSFEWLRSSDVTTPVVSDAVTDVTTNVADVATTVVSDAVTDVATNVADVATTVVSDAVTDVATEAAAASIPQRIAWGIIGKGWLW